MQEILTVAEMRRSDAAAISAGTPGRELMRRAGEGIFRAGAWKAPAAVVCGTGNNAGDGFVLTGLLEEAGISCEILLQEEKFTPDGRYWFDRCMEKNIPVRMWADVSSLDGYGSIADCIFGTGFHGTAAGEAARMIRMINDSGADLVWIGLGAPKQEKWMAAHKDKINGVMLGVGAGFDFHAGTIDRAPKLIQGIGLEWLYRLFQNPRRLFKRYLVTNTKFILYSKFKKKK